MHNDWCNSIDRSVWTPCSCSSDGSSRCVWPAGGSRWWASGDCIQLESISLSGWWPAIPSAQQVTQYLTRVTGSWSRFIGSWHSWLTGGSSLSVWAIGDSEFGGISSSWYDRSGWSVYVACGSSCSGRCRIGDSLPYIFCWLLMLTLLLVVFLCYCQPSQTAACSL